MDRVSCDRGGRVSMRILLPKVLRSNDLFSIQTRSPGPQRPKVTSESDGEGVSYEEAMDQQVRGGGPTSRTRPYGYTIGQSEAAAPKSPHSTLAFLNLFLGLPGELQLGILCELGLCDIFSLRASCRTFHEVIVLQASSIIRHVVRTSTLAKQLGDYVGMYPLPKPTSQLNLDYLYDLSHRLHVVDKLTQHLANFVVTKIFPLDRRIVHCSPIKTYINNSIWNMRPVLLVLLHFFERYRAELVHYATKRISCGEFAGFLPCCGYEESEIIRRYDDPAQLWRAYNMYRLLGLVLARKLRLPSYVGRFESTLRGWGRKPATEESLVQLILLGGFKGINNVLDSRSYRARLKTLQEYLPRMPLPAEQTLATRQLFPCHVREEVSRLRRKTEPANDSAYPRVVPTVGNLGSPAPCSALRKISCSVLPQLGIHTAFEVSRFLPTYDDMWRTAAERRMVELGVIQSSEDLPELLYFLIPFLLGDMNSDLSENAGG